MSVSLNKITESLTQELNLIWAAHHNVGLDGYMCLYTNAEQIPFRTKEAGINFWFGPNDTKAAVDMVIEHYNNGRLPNSPLLLNPIVHRKESDDRYIPVGSGIIWTTALSLGIDVLSTMPSERLTSMGVFSGVFQRGISQFAGIKAIGFCDTAQPAKPDGKTVNCCYELYEIIDMKSEQYEKSYFLSGISYLTNNGLFEQPHIASLFPQGAKLDSEFIKKNTVTGQSIYNSSKCWKAYDKLHSLYQKFGNDPNNIEKNLRFFNLVARDINLFDATGSAKADKNIEVKDLFEFIVPGILPRGSVTLLAGPSSSGRSSLTHQLAALASTDYQEGQESPKWLGQPIDISQCKGINIYFSGEDGPQIFNARANMIDPDGKASRLLFQRTDFGEGVTFDHQLRYLQKIPDVPLLIIDPSRKYLGGDENDTNTVNKFFDAIENFAVQKNAAVLVVHHLQRGASPKSMNEIIDYLGGAQAFIDRPRIIIGMYRDGPYTVAGLAKNNIPPNLGMVTEERVFARDQKNLSLVWLSGPEGIRNAALTEAEVAKIARQSHEK